MKLGFLCARCISPVLISIEILLKLKYIKKDEVKLLTDRDTTGIEYAINNNLEAKKIYWTDKIDFSKKAYEYFYDCDATLSIFSRLLSEDLYYNIPTLNIHPSLLPSFKGSKPMQRQQEFGSRFLGASLHMIDETVDGGPIIAQIISPLPINSSFEYIERKSYLQRVYLVLLYIELFKENIINANPKSNSVEILKYSGYNEYANPRLLNKEIEKEYELLVKNEIYKLF